jgi:hypothetical protein
MAKGGDFARDMAKEFSLYLTQMKIDDGVWLTEGSGARATNKRKAKQQTRLDQFGDITYTVPECKYWFDVFSVECKTGYAKKTKGKKHVTLTHWSLMDMIDSHQKVSQFHEFWEQCLNDAIESKREPMLVFRRNRRTPCITFREDIFVAFTRRFGSPDFNYIILVTLFDPLSIVTMNLRHFFDWTQQINESIFLQTVTRPLMKRR